MSSLSSIYIKKETLKTLLDTVNQKGEKGVELTVSIQEETNNYGQNLSAFVSQSQEQREAKAKRFYVGNGKVFWTDGLISKADSNSGNNQNQTTNNQQEEEDDLPF
jgi:hypothetical protein